MESLAGAFLSSFHCRRTRKNLPLRVAVLILPAIAVRGTPMFGLRRFDDPGMAANRISFLRQFRTRRLGGISPARFQS